MLYFSHSIYQLKIPNIMVAHFNDYDPFKEESYLKAMAENLPSKEIEDYFLEEEADSYLSSLEAHESIF